VVGAGRRAKCIAAVYHKKKLIGFHIDKLWGQIWFISPHVSKKLKGNRLSTRRRDKKAEIRGKIIARKQKLCETALHLIRLLGSIQIDDQGWWWIYLFYMSTINTRMMRADHTFASTVQRSKGEARHEIQ